MDLEDLLTFLLSSGLFKKLSSQENTILNAISVVNRSNFEKVQKAMKTG